MKSIIYILFTLILSLYVFLGWVINDEYNYFISIITALFFPVCMIFFYRKIDVFEKEKLSHLLIVFFLSGVIMHLVGFPIIYIRDIYIGGLEDSFLRLFLGVGLFEEIIKIIPVLLVLKFGPLKRMNMINEPIDFIIYSSISALSFAFFENVDYIYENRGSTDNIVALRSFIPLLVHTFFSSLIGFGLFCSKVAKNKSHFFKYLFIAATLHTLYDISILNFVPIWIGFIIPVVVLVGSAIYYGKLIHSMLNISPFYDEKKKHDIGGAIQFLFGILALVFLIDFIDMSIVSGSEGIIQNLSNYNYHFLIFVVFIYSRLSKYLFINKGDFIIKTSAQDDIIKNFYNNIEKDK